MGIRYAADNGANVINLSLGTESSSSVLKNAIDYAYGKGCVIVAAAGNSGTRSVHYPAAYPNVIGVGNTSNGTTKVSSSSYGPGLDVMAIGTYLTTATSGGYASATGTSFASPQVAGLCALLLSVNPNLTQEEITQYIINGCTDMVDTGWDEQTGWGFVNFQKTIEILLDDMGEMVIIKYVDKENTDTVLNTIDAGIIQIGETYIYTVPKEYTKNGLWELSDKENLTRSHIVKAGTNEILVEYERKMADIEIEYVEKKNHEIVLNRITEEERIQVGTEYIYTVPKLYSYNGTWKLANTESLVRSHEVAKGINKIYVEYEKVDAILTKELAEGQKDTAMPGETVKYKITVENTGDADLYNIIITDSLNSTWKETIGVLKSKGIKEYEFIYQVPFEKEEGEMINTVKLRCDEIEELTAITSIIIEYQKVEIKAVYENTSEPNDIYIEIFGFAKIINAKDVEDMCVAEVWQNSVKVEGLIYPIISYEIEELNETEYEIVFVYVEDLNNDKIPDELQQIEIKVAYENTGEPNETYTQTFGLGTEIMAKNVSDMCVSEIKVNGVSVIGLTYPVERYKIESVLEEYEVIFVYAEDLNSDGIPDEYQGGNIIVVYENTSNPNDIIEGISGVAKEIFAKNVVDMCVKMVKLNGEIQEGLVYPIESYKIVSVSEQGDTLIFVYAADKNKNGVPDDEEQVEIKVSYENTSEPNDIYTETFGLSKILSAKPVSGMCVAEVRLNGDKIEGLEYPITSYVIESIREAGDIVTFVYANDLNKDGIPDEEQEVSITVVYVNTGKPNDMYTETVGLSKEVFAKDITGMCVAEVWQNSVKVSGLTYPITSYVVEKIRAIGDIVAFVYAPDLNKNGIPDELEQVEILVIYENTEIMNDVFTETFGLRKTLSAKTVSGMCVAEVRLNGNKLEGLSYPITECVIESIRKTGDTVTFIYATDLNKDGVPDEYQKVTVTVIYENIEIMNDTFVETFGLKKEIPVKVVPNMCVAEVKLNNVTIHGLTYPITKYTIESIREAGDTVTFIYAADLNKNGIPDEHEKVTIKVIYENTALAADTYIEAFGASKTVDAKTIANMCVKETRLNEQVVDTATLTHKITSYTITNIKADNVVRFIYAADLNNDGIPDGFQTTTVKVKYENTDEKEDIITATPGLSKTINAKMISGKHVTSVKLNGSIITGLNLPITSYTISSVRLEGDEVIFVYEKDAETPTPPPIQKPETSEPDPNKKPNPILDTTQNSTPNQPQTQSQTQPTNQNSSKPTTSQTPVNITVAVTFVYKNTEEPDEKLIINKGNGVVIVPKKIEDKCVDTVTVNGVEIEGIMANYPLRDITKSTQIVLNYAEDLNRNGIPDYKEVAEEQEKEKEEELKEKLDEKIEIIEEQRNTINIPEITQAEDSGISPKTVAIGAVVIIAVLSLALLAVIKL